LNRTVALFKCTIRNTPEIIIPGRTSTKGRIEYQFVVFGGLSVLVIEVKYVLKSGEDRLNAIAQVVAECDGMVMLASRFDCFEPSFSACDYANDRLDFPPFPVYAILCDGMSFEFFSFDGNSRPPTFSRGVFPTSTSKPQEMITLANYHSSSDDVFIRSLRPLCETLFYFFLLTFRTGIEAFLQRSAIRANKDKRPQASTPSWQEALGQARQALELAVEAADKASHQDPAADAITDSALEHLQVRLVS
jgi:hypothetical protein